MKAGLAPPGAVLDLYLGLVIGRVDVYLVARGVGVLHALVEDAVRIAEDGTVATVLEDGEAVPLDDAKKMRVLVSLILSFALLLLK